jgi:TPR repeat protein
MAAEQGQAESQFMTGMMYMKLNENAEAVKWYRKAADQGIAMAGISTQAIPEIEQLRRIQF